MSEYSQEQIINMAAAIGAQAALEQFAKEAAAQKRENEKKSKARQDRRLRNTKLLLRNYKMLVAHCQNAVCGGEYDQEDEDAEVSEMLDLMSDSESGPGSQQLMIDSITRSRARTRIMLEHVNVMLALYEAYCYKSAKEEDRRRYDVIYKYYIADEPYTIRNIADEWHIDTRTVYKDIGIATERLSALIFGIDSMK